MLDLTQSGISRAREIYQDRSLRAKELKAEGNYYGVVVTGGAIFATANGDDTKGWIVRSVIKDGEPQPLERYIATKEAVEVDAPDDDVVGLLQRRKPRDVRDAAFILVG